MREEAQRYSLRLLYIAKGGAEESFSGANRKVEVRILLSPIDDPIAWERCQDHNRRACPDVKNVNLCLYSDRCAREKPKDS